MDKEISLQVNSSISSDYTIYVYYYNYYYYYYYYYCYLANCHFKLGHALPIPHPKRRRHLLSF